MSYSISSKEERERANAMPHDQINFWKALYNGNFDLLSENNLGRAKAAGKKVYYVVETSLGSASTMKPHEQAKFCKRFIDNAASASLQDPKKEGKIFYQFLTDFTETYSDAEEADNELKKLNQKIKSLTDLEGINRAQLEARKQIADLDGSIENLARKANLYTVLEKVLDNYGKAAGLDNLKLEQAIDYIGKLLVKIGEEQEKQFNNLLEELPDEDD